MPGLVKEGDQNLVSPVSSRLPVHGTEQLCLVFFDQF